MAGSGKGADLFLRINTNIADIDGEINKYIDKWESRKVSLTLILPNKNDIIGLGTLFNSLDNINTTKLHTLNKEMKSLSETLKNINTNTNNDFLKYLREKEASIAKQKANKKDPTTKNAQAALKESKRVYKELYSAREKLLKQTNKGIGVYSSEDVKKINDFTKQLDSAIKHQEKTIQKHLYNSETLDKQATKKHNEHISTAESLVAESLLLEKKYADKNAKLGVADASVLEQRQAYINKLSKTEDNFIKKKEELNKLLQNEKMLGARSSGRIKKEIASIDSFLASFDALKNSADQSMKSVKALEQLDKKSSKHSLTSVDSSKIFSESSKAIKELEKSKKRNDLLLSKSQGILDNDEVTNLQNQNKEIDKEIRKHKKQLLIYKDIDAAIYDSNKSTHEDLLKDTDKLLRNNDVLDKDYTQKLTDAGVIDKSLLDQEEDRVKKYTSIQDKIAEAKNKLQKALSEDSSTMSDAEKDSYKNTLNQIDSIEKRFSDIQKNISKKGIKPEDIVDYDTLINDASKIELPEKGVNKALDESKKMYETLKKERKKYTAFMENSNNNFTQSELDNMKQHVASLEKEEQLQKQLITKYSKSRNDLYGEMVSSHEEYLKQSQDVLNSSYLDNQAYTDKNLNKNKVRDAASAIEKEYKAIQNKITDFEAKINKESAKKTPLISDNLITEYRKQITELRGLLDEYQQIKSKLNSGLNTSDALSDYSRVKDEIRAARDRLEVQEAEFNSVVKPSTQRVNDTIALDKMGDKVLKLMEEHEYQLKKNIPLYDKARKLLSNINEGSISPSDATAAFSALRKEMREAGVMTETFGSKMNKVFNNKFFNQFAYEGYAIMNLAVRDLLRNSVEIDTAMTELKKVTNETDAVYSQFLDNASTRAKTLGATLSEVVSATSDYARLGYDIEQASTLADSALIYSNVGDDLGGIDDASSALISTMKGFGIEAENSMSIVDKFNEVANNYASSAGDIGEMVKRSAASMSAAGNTLDQTNKIVWIYGDIYCKTHLIAG